MREALRKQARALLKKMIDDPLNPVDESWAPALTGTGGATRRTPAARRAVEAGETWQATAMVEASRAFPVAARSLLS